AVERSRGDQLVDAELSRRSRAGLAHDADDARVERARQSRDLAADLAEPDHADELASNLVVGMAFPSMRTLLPRQVEGVLAEHQHRKQCELRQRSGVDAARGRDDDIGLEQPDALDEPSDAGARALDPAKPLPRGERGRELERPEVEED